MGRPGFKYGLLILPADGGSTEPEKLGGGTTWRGRALELLDPPATKHWREWLGSIRWEESVEHHRQLVLRFEPSVAVDVADDENARLLRQLRIDRLALLLAAPRLPMSGEAWLASGECGDGGRPLRSIRHWEPSDRLVAPFYTTRTNGYMRAARLQGADAWLERWVAITDQLTRLYPSLPDIVRLAIKSYAEALRQTELDFRLPGFVRATEAIIALPKKSVGAASFAERVVKLVPSLASHWWVGTPDLDRWLRELYVHRNDCVHGKIPFLELRQKGDAGRDEAARFEYLAEIVARESIRYALNSPSLLAAAVDRASLEAAWAANAPP